MQIEGYQIIEEKSLEEGYKLLKFASTQRDKMILVLQSPGEEGGEFFGGSDHAFIEGEVGLLDVNFNDIKNAEEFVQASHRVRQNIDELMALKKRGF